MSVPAGEMMRRLGVDPQSGADAVSRRSFIQLLGASLALAGLEGCTRMPPSHILPYAEPPELTPGVPQYYATSMVLDGFATGLVVESHDGRPTKVEGNPDHPASLGAAGVYEQASVLQLYDPDRARGIAHRGRTSSWAALAAALRPEALQAHVGRRGAGLFLLLPPTSSPLEIELLDRIREQYPDAGIHFYSPVAPPNDSLVPQYDFRAADVIVTAEADFLASGPFHLRYARQYAERRRPESAAGMNRLYAIECSVTPTGAAADHRLSRRPSQTTSTLARLRDGIRADTDAGGSDPIGAMARDLRAHRGRSLVVAGPHLPPSARALAQQINETLGNIGRTVWFTRSALAGAGDPRHSFASLIDALGSGAVDTLVCMGTNPSYATAGADRVSDRLRQVRESVYLGLYEDETARDCAWMVPALHYLESWGDARAYDGTLSIVQPLIRPLHGGHTAAEMLSLLLGAPDLSAYEMLRQSWQRRGPGDGTNDAEGWRSVLRRGFVEGSAFTAAPAAPVAPTLLNSEQTFDTIEIVVRPHPRVYDGRFANNVWLQELPDPVTTLTWENAAQLSPDTAKRLGVVTGDVVDIRAADRTLRVPILLVAGHADDAVTVQLGYGRDGAETVARAAGVNVYPFWPGGAFSIGGASVSPAPGQPQRKLPVTQPHHTLATTEAVRSTTLNGFRSLDPPRRSRTLTLYQPPISLPDGPAPQQWAMSIDLGACIGCGACMVACQAENNVPAVGREQVLNGREMHWLRIDWYAEKPGEAGALSQPMLCQHCEKAPCEYVCPVEATVHSRDGLNEMVYNRCVGTRFCSNNCPYKVRRFNWFDFNANLGPTERLVENPDVTVRERGVMEKCTFCVQRIRQAEISARVEAHPLDAGAVQTACQQACPTRAIVFGSLTDAGSEVVRERNSPRAYAVLDELGTEPRVRYLMRVRNPNPEMEPAS